MMPPIADQEGASLTATAIAAGHDAAGGRAQLAAGVTAQVVGDPIADPSPATRALYAGDWARFVTWCREQHRTPLPASTETLTAYLIDCAPRLSRGALGRCRSAITTAHRQAGLPTPLLDPATHKTLRAAAKPKGTRPAPQPTTARLVSIAAQCPRDLPGLRDCALLLLAAATIRPSRRGKGAAGPLGQTDEAVATNGVARLFVLALDAEDIRFTPAGVELRLRTRTDEAMPSRTVTLTRATAAATCPVRALEEWLRRSETAFGPVFRKVDRWGNVEHGRLGPDAWHRILQRRAEALRRTAAATQRDR